MLKDLFSSFLGQGIIGFGVIALIIALSIYGIVVSLRIRNSYKELNYGFERGSILNYESREKTFESNVLNEIVKDFKNSAQKGTDNINTEVLILKHLRNNFNLNDKFMNMIPAISIALGLLGTFLGLTVAIHSTKGVLVSGVNSMELFLSEMGLPLQGMASAFWTSIFGVFVSIILNFIISLVKREKDMFFDTFEDYLDNLIYGENFYGFAKQFEKFNNTLENTMKDLTKEMRALFREGVEELVEKINKNTIDMTETAKEMSNYTVELSRVIKSLDNTVDSFSMPVEIFKKSIDNFEINTDKFKNIMDDATSNLSLKIDSLGDKIITLEKSIGDENVIMTKSLQTLLGIKGDLEISYNRLVESTEYIKDSIDISSNKLEVQLSNLQEGYDGFERGLYEFLETVDSLKSGITESVTSILKLEMEDLSKDIIRGLDESIAGITEATQSLSKNTNTIAKLVKATNDWAFASRG
ncbi:MotA/TolQ/ExbB proton channel family protein [Clostridium sp. LY3-2]|uniref:MotA/TolQ/ExbB proton channel family protein n=1 Tax=Clostridium sp. LY3-2 TaxID=2942482 RepID=UPI0021536D87|nr:MotA/TolQ/ExbB proton channel family protein [Clostridium sp. LY3-2]MCR6516384.1 MotA/TolQ/ExbB proton channel family protein [Clostridium sp. LY3-2]